MKLSFIRAVGAVLVAAGGAFGQTSLPGTSPDARPEPRATAPARNGTAAPRNGNGTLPAVTSAAPAAVSSWMPPAGQPCPDKSLMPAGCLDSYGPTYTFWANAEYLLWRIENGSIPDLTARPPVGVLTVTARDFERTFRSDGSATPFVLVDQTLGFFPVQINVIPTIPDGPVHLGNHSGVRFGGGMWFTPDQTFGAETSFYFLGKRSNRFNNTAANENGQFIFNTPFADRDFEVIPGTGNPPGPSMRNLVATRPIFFVRQANSELTGNYSTNSWGGELNARSTFFTIGGVAVGGLVGFRYVDFHEGFDLDGRFSLFRPNIPGSGDPPGSNLAERMIISTHDRIFTRNHYYAGQIGADFNGTFHRVFVSVRPRIALGGVRQVVRVEGSTTTTLDGVVTNSRQGGLLFAPLDVGRSTRQRIAVLPELNLKAGYEVTSWLRAYVGYDIMGFYNMVRPGDVSVVSTTSTQVTSAPPAGSSGGSSSTTVVNVTQPTLRVRDSDILIQGFNFGIELRY